MNKKQLVAAISAQTGLSEEDAQKAITAFTDIISDKMQKGEKVVLLNFGVFDTRKQNGKGKWDFKNGKSMEVVPRRSAYFKNAPELKRKLNS